MLVAISLQFLFLLVDLFLLIHFMRAGQPANWHLLLQCHMTKVYFLPLIALRVLFVQLYCLSNAPRIPFYEVLRGTGHRNQFYKFMLFDELQ